MDRRTLIAVGLSILIFLGWQKFVLQKYQQAPQQLTSDAQIQKPSAPTSEKQFQEPVATASHPVVTPIEAGEISLGSGSAAFDQWVYRPQGSEEGSSDSSLKINMKSLVGSMPQVELAVDSSDYRSLNTLTGALVAKSETEYQWVAENESVKVSRDIRVFKKEGFVDLTYSAEFKKSKPNFAFVSLVGSQATPEGEERDRKWVYFSGKEHHSLSAGKPVDLTDVLLPVEWIGIENRYFLMSVVDRSGSARGLLQPLAGELNRLSLVYPVASSQLVLPVRVYFGPKSVEALKAVHPSLDHAVDFGWLTPLAYAILHFMKWLFSFIGNYGVAIILLTVILKVLMYPLTYKSMKSMKKMATIQPQLQRLRERFKDDKEALNREMLQLMRTNGYNPVAGCLPMLLQMPIFFALYRVLYSSFELYRTPFALWIHDLSKHDPWYVTPVVLTGVMYLQQKLTPTTATDPAQQKMIQLMPVIFGVFMLGLPAGLTLYMLTNAVVSIIQQIILNKRLGLTPVASSS
ncbi:MAG: hypothetical protein RJB38_177 [Pseudomonadota bacterium]